MQPPHESVRPILEDFLGAYAHRPVPGVGLSQKVAHLVPQSLRPMVRRVATDVIAPYQRRRAERLQDGRELRLNLGCGSLALDGWVNVDLLGLRVNLAWNVARPLPFRANSVDAIFHEHVLEHLPAPTGYAFLQECHRVLRTGAVMRAVIPDAGKYIRSYCDPTHEFLNSWRQVATRGLPMLLGIQEEFYGFGHRTMYDFETFAFFCKAVGFNTVEEKTFGESRLQPCPDSDWRKTDSFYADVLK